MRTATPYTTVRSLPQAYRVPFVVDRTGAGRLRLINRGAERLEAVTLLLHGPGVLDATVIGPVPPGAAVRARVRGAQLERATSVVVRWFRPDGEEYLWRVVF